MTKCPDCPIAGRCVVEWTGHAAYCGWARAGGARRERVIELSRTPPEGPAPADARPMPADPSVAESLALLAAAKACPFASRDSACGCQGTRCALARRVVAVQDCMSCIRRYGP